MVLFNELGRLWRELNASRGYQEVRTPILYDTGLWKRSGHWDNYRDKMFLTEQVEGRQFGLKPMNCPGHVEIYNQRRHSYRDLPLRLAEQGLVHRNEDSGIDARPPARAAHHAGRRAHLLPLGPGRGGGRRLPRARGRDLRDVRAGRARRALDPAGQAPRQRGGVGPHGGALASALATAGWAYVENPGDGAFYAPKIDLHMTDSIGRSWQMGTIQLDGWMPQRLDATYTTSEDELERPFMIHRALFGSFERFIGILIEHFAGAFPLWLAPVQVAVLPLSSELREYADEVVAALRAAGLRAELDAREEKVGRKIHDAEVRRCRSCSCSAAARPRPARSRCGAMAAESTPVCSRSMRWSPRWPPRRASAASLRLPDARRERPGPGRGGTALAERSWRHPRSRSAHWQ